MNSQAEDRVHRIGQKTAPVIISLIVKDSIESRVEELLLQKKGFLDEIFNESVSDEEIGTKLSVAQVLKMIRRRDIDE